MEIFNSIKDLFGEYLERLVLILAGFGVGVKVMVINHNIDPGNLNLDLMPADYVILICAPLVVALLALAITKWGNQEISDDQDELQELANEILEIAAAEGYTDIEDITNDKGIVKSSDLLKANLKPEGA